MSNYGRERVVFVEIDQPLCRRVYGDFFASPTPAAGCHAALSSTETRKCFNTRFTCQDEDNYDPGTLTLRFSMQSQIGITARYGFTIPSLLTHKITPGMINLGGMNSSAKALGQREVLTLSFEDHLYDDLLVDKYRLERRTGAAAFGSPTAESYDPYTRGTFWGKWLARNPYHQGYALRLYVGFLGDRLSFGSPAESDMEVRHYIIDRIEGPAEGMVKIVAKDEFSMIESKKAVAPPASRGELGSNLTAVGSSAALSPTGIGNEDYPYLPASPSELWVQINDEIMKCTRSGDTLTLVTRGAFNTDAAAHEDEDLVQWCLVYFAQRAHDIVYDLLVNYAGVNPARIDLDDWDIQAESMTQLYTAVISTPTPVQDLIGELSKIAGFSIWHDPVTNMIELRALRAQASVDTLTDDDAILDGSLSTARQDDKRVSQVWIYYGMKNPAGDLEDRRNYYSRVVAIDPEAEESDQYKTPKIEVIYSRWIPQFGRNSAVEAAERILSIFRNPPYEAAFALDASRDEDIGIADFVTLETAEIQDATGSADTQRQFAITSKERNWDRLTVTAQQVAFASIPGTASENDPRTIYIENNAYNLNMRTIHDSLYDAPEESSPSLSVTFNVITGVVVGSTSTASPAMTTGSWPTTVDLYLVNNGRIQGKGGAGGTGGTFAAGFPFSPSNPTAGATGGPALEATRPLRVDNTNGQIWGGGGGGGGGGWSNATYDGGESGTVTTFAAGGGGGGATGTDGGSGGSGGTSPEGPIASGAGGNAGGSESGGSGGSKGTSVVIAVSTGGDGGTGGGPGLAGSAGSAGSAPSSGGFTSDGNVSAGASGGAAGNYIVGNSFVTWVANGDRRGNVA